ncbi:hypothetical protein BGZ61DRAFT_20363 [Ilyonectria robusta]|uniref:uncharacterized protein n=1 Tax=Ilyonectria robusta TaxID=1079257 RepID=UPI001E8E15D3|nr:uncharacterized protein BGZ61DRAFT_20363 [Ilyonectria robusta]KAH8737674.1 hypothetical protein BGZ61DRAFT_20363 [Ilyonectria robusta]
MSTTTKVVGPGDQTGIYYIPISNLPFGITWHPVKQWISAIVEVDRVEIFPASTFGWIRVNGRANFNKAMEFLNTDGFFRGRRIVSGATNGTNPITIKEHVDPLRPESYQTSPYQTAPPTQRESDIRGVSHGQNYPTGYGQGNATPYAGPSVAAPYYSQQPSIATNNRMLPVYATANSGNPFNYASQASGPQAGGAAPMGQFGPAYPAQYQGGHQGGYQSGHQNAYQNAYQNEGAQFTAPYHGQTQSQTYNDGYATSGDNQPEYRATEQRKLHISPFPQQADKKRVVKWIDSRVGNIKTLTLEVPQNENSRYLRGHAFVIFANSEDAKTVMGRVNKSKFDNQRMKAKLCQEGVTNLEVDEELKRTEPVVPTGPKYIDRHRGEKGHRSKQTGSVSSDKTRASSAKKPISSSKTNDKKPSPKDEEPVYTGPVIADGSSRKPEKR